MCSLLLAGPYVLSIAYIDVSSQAYASPVPALRKHNARMLICYESDDDSAVRSSSQIEQMGNLRVTISPVVYLGHQWYSAQPNPLSFPGDRAVHERSKKGGSHVVRRDRNTIVFRRRD